MKKKLKYLFITALLVTFTVCFAVSASADEIHEEDANEAVEENLFATVYSEVSKYAGEILCAMTFAGSLILAVSYKKGLLPLVKGSLISIGNAIGKIKDTTDVGIEKSAELNASFDGAKEVLTELADKVDTLDSMLKQRLEEEDAVNKEKEALKLILRSQIDMLYDIFMTAALPQYQKDAVGERIAAMKGALAENDERV